MHFFFQRKGKTADRRQAGGQATRVSGRKTPRNRGETAGNRGETAGIVVGQGSAGVDQLVVGGGKPA